MQLEFSGILPRLDLLLADAFNTIWISAVGMAFSTAIGAGGRGKNIRASATVRRGRRQAGRRIGQAPFP